MKKVIMLVAGMGLIGGTFAQAAAPVTGATSSITQTVNASVLNACTYNPFNEAYAGASVQNPNPFPNGPKTLSGSYNALNGAQNQNFDHYIIRCTAGTPFKLSTDLASPSNSGDSHTTGRLDLKNGTSTLEAYVSIDDTLVNNAGQYGAGDVHYGNMNVSIPLGQWNSVAGNYSAAFTTTVTYN